MLDLCLQATFIYTYLTATLVRLRVGTHAICYRYPFNSFRGK